MFGEGNVERFRDHPKRIEEEINDAERISILASTCI